MRNALTLLFLIFLTTPVFAAEDTSMPPMTEPSEMSAPRDISSLPKRAALAHTDIQNHYAIAYERFIQSNVKSAYSDFRFMIESIVPDDFAYMQLCEKMADIGLFNLSELAMAKLSDKDTSSLFIDDVRRYYFPNKKLQRVDEIYLGEVFTNIMYNDQSLEATAELIKNEGLLKSSDYANYIVALGYLKSNNIPNASKYIDKAISMNPQNINYRKLNAEILAQSKKPQNALGVVAHIKQQRLNSYTFTKKVNSLEQYILYKTAKTENQKMYHLGYYYYYENEPVKAIRTLQSAIGKKKDINANTYAIMSKIYFDTNEFEKAQDTALKSIKSASNNSTALLVLGDLQYRNKDYKAAMKYYKDAESSSKNSSLPLIRIAQTYEQTGKAEKALETYEKILKNFSDCYQAYYKIALRDKSKELIYLKKAVAINMFFKDGWIDLARLELDRGNDTLAGKYLAIVSNIDENDFRYYYYLGMVFKKQGLTKEASNSFKRSLLLNPNYEPAKKEIINI